MLPSQSLVGQQAYSNVWCCFGVLCLLATLSALYACGLESTRNPFNVNDVCYLKTQSVHITHVSCLKLGP